VYGGKLSYLDYLQAVSFEKSFKSHISAQMRAIIASDEDLAEAHIKVTQGLRGSVERGFLDVTRGIGELHGSVSRGFETLHLDLNDIKEGIADLQSGVAEVNQSIRWGFTELLSTVGTTNKSLEKLIHHAETPSQRWAYEQFKIAEVAYRRNLYPEAIESTNRAIDGHLGNTGYKLEWRFHFLLGTIRLGSARNTASDIVSLHKAESHFLDAARYSRMDAPNEAARAMVAAGWAAYCQGKMTEASRHTQQACELDQAFGEAHFQLAKVRMHVREAEGALPSLRRAITINCESLRIYEEGGRGR
jgi:tetratricopeptide (TPR) repeat protein